MNLQSHPSDFSLSARILIELAERAKEVAKLKGLNMSSLVRQGLKDRIETYVRQNNRPATVWWYLPKDVHFPMSC